MAGMEGGGGLDPALFYQPVEEHDAVVILTLPLDALEAEEEQGIRTRGAKRRRSEEPEEAAAARIIMRHDACAYQLKSASPKFRAVLERWSGEGGKRELRFECADEQEAESWGHLLDCIHSMGRTLPPGLDAVLRLLLLAREQAAEPAVAACLRALHSQADQLPAGVCLQLLSHLETGVSEHEQLQALGDRLLAAACKRVGELLKEDEATRADPAVQAQLLAFLGPLQHMLSDPQRRGLFAKLPFQLLRDCVFEDRNVNADAEVTVLAAFVIWAEANLKLWEDGSREQATAICKRIRFPDIPAGLLCLYKERWSLGLLFDTTGAVLRMAIVAAADREQLKVWENDHTGMVIQEGSPAAQLTAICSSWWTPRVPALLGRPQLAEFEVQVRLPEDAKSVNSPTRYWGGCFWRINLRKSAKGSLSAFLQAALCPMCSSFPDRGKPGIMTFGVRVQNSVSLQGTSCSWSGSSSVNVFYPARVTSWGWAAVNHNGQPIAWDAFWAADSPWLVNGAARVRFTLQAPA